MKGGETMDAVYTVAELAKHWKCHENSIRKLEEEGKLHRLTELPGVRYSAREVSQLQTVGLDAEVPTAWEFRQLKEENASLKRKLHSYEELVAKIATMALGGT